ncbi:MULTISPECIES: phosphotransferase family protein [Frankia]|uniref:phosphotransferase family protein n=1 Tax=Frankia TaxID=1854 RepID=UPI00211888F7|nr:MULTISPECIES: phosphotransferase [Frankia]
MNSADRPPAEGLAARIRAAGVAVDRTGLTPGAGGADNTVFTARAISGERLIIKVALAPPPRYATAAWAAQVLAAQGIPAPQVLWHDSTACVETRCPGLPLGGTAPGTPSAWVLRAAQHAGRLLRRAHGITVGGYGRLTPTGSGPYRSLLDSLRPRTAGRLPVDPSGGLAASARQIITSHLWRLRDTGPHLLLGDCAARHIFYDPDTTTTSGFIDLESVRGGDPLADLAGFTVQEHPHLSLALIEGYFPDGISVDDTWALTVHRARIATSLLLFHLTRGQQQPAALLAAVLTADLSAITAETPTVLPALRPQGAPSWP